MLTVVIDWQRADLLVCRHGQGASTDGKLALTTLPLTHPRASLLSPWLQDGCIDEAPVWGGFAAISVDVRQRRLRAATGARSEVPLVWAQEGARTVVSTEVPALLDHLDAAPQPDPLASLLMVTGDAEPTATGYVGVHRLAAGHHIDVAEGRRPEVRAWHDPRRFMIEIRSARDEVRAMRRAIRSAVADDLATSTPTVVALSAGLDSATVATTAAALEPRGVVTGLCHGGTGDPGDDAPLARLLASPRLAVEVHPPPADRVGLDLIDDAIRVSGVPVANTAALVWWRQLADRTRTLGSPWLLTGQSGNDTYSGPPRRHPQLLREIRRMSGWVGLSQATRYDRAGLVRTIRALRTPDTPTPRWQRWLDAGVAADLLNDATPPDHRPLGLPPQLPLSLRAYTGGLRVRDPLADPRVVGVALSLPAQAWLRGGTSRSVARRASVGLLPDAIRLRRTRGAQSLGHAAARLRRQSDYLAAIDMLADDTLVASVLDFPRLRASVAAWSEHGTSRRWDRDEGRLLSWAMFLHAAQQTRATKCPDQPETVTGPIVA